jgi:hypothetical protein
MKAVEEKLTRGLLHLLVGNSKLRLFVPDAQGDSITVREIAFVTEPKNVANPRRSTRN